MSETKMTVHQLERLADKLETAIIATNMKLSGNKLSEGSVLRLRSAPSELVALFHKGQFQLAASMSQDVIYLVRKFVPNVDEEGVMALAQELSNEIYFFLEG